MTLRHLEIFMSVYHQKSITKAANELHISQPSVSLAIKELEEKYQTILFDRMNRQIYPTEKACILYNHSMQILSSLENMENEMYNDQVKSISFGCSMTLSQVLLPHFLKTLKEKYPTIDFHINVNNLKEIENYDYYSREKGSSIYELVQSYFISHKLDIHPSIECVNPSSLIDLVRYNNGFTILPSSLVKNEKEIALIKNKDFYIQRTYHIVMHKDKKLSSIYQEIFELIKNYPK